MNKNLIQRLLNQSCWDEQDQRELEDWCNVEKFAELIVRESAESLWTEECYNSDLALEEFEKNRKKILKHFGVEE